MNYPILSDLEVAEIFTSIPDEVLKKMKIDYREHGYRAKRRKLEMRYSFEQWAAVWWNSGKWDLRGRTKAKPYQMCRKDDLGHYEMGNVRIDTQQSNLNDESFQTARQIAQNRPEVRAKKRESLAKVRESRCASIREALAKPETKERQKAASREVNARPEVRAKKTGINNTNSKPVIATCIATGAEFELIGKTHIEASGFRSPAVSECCTGKKKHYKGHTFRFK